MSAQGSSGPNDQPSVALPPAGNYEQDLAPGAPARREEQQGGKKRRSSSKKPKSRKSQRGGQTQGGSLVASVSSLAVPFGLMFAKQSLKAFLEKARQQKRPSSPKKLKRRPLRRYVGGEVLDGHEAAAVQQQGGFNADALLPAAPGRVTDAEAFSQTFPQMPHHGASAEAQAGGKKKKRSSKKPKAHRGGERQDEQEQAQQRQEQQQEGGKKRRSSSKKPAKSRSASKKH